MISITALAVLPNGNIAAAGNTNSPDLGVSGLSGQYGGGASDAFVVLFSGDLLHLLWGSYLGGSGDDTVSAVATNARNETLIGGATSSPDFPASAAPASPCGQGLDGFWAHFDPIGRSIASSCVGGSGTDRINSVAFDQDVHIFLGGSSNSLDLALKNSPQAANAGLSDGFYLTVAEAVIHATDVTVGKDLAATETALLGDPQNTVGTPLTATSSDSSRVLFGLRPDDPGQPSVTVASGAGIPDQRSFLVYCLVSSGDIPITLSAPAYPDLTVTIHCVPSGLLSPTSVSVSVGSQTTVTLMPVALDPFQKVIGSQTPRGGLDPIRIDATNLNPDLINVVPSSIVLDQFSNLSSPFLSNFTVQRIAGGEASVSFSTPSGFPILPSNVLLVHQAGSASLNLYVPRVVPGLLGQMFPTTPYGSVPAQVPLTFTSSDPSKARITTDPLQHGQASATVTTAPSVTPPVWVEMLDSSGPVSITVSAPGYVPATVPVLVGKLALGFFLPRDTTQLDQLSLPLTNGTAAIEARLFVNPPNYVPVYPDPNIRLGPDGSPISIVIKGSAPDVVLGPSTNPVTLATAGGVLNNAGFGIGALTAGTSVFTLDPGSSKIRVLGPLTVTVQAPAFKMQPITLGYNAAVQLPISLVGGSLPDGTPIQVTTSDPSRVLLSADGTSAGQASITIKSPIPFPGPWVYGLASSGPVDITATAANFGTSKSTVTLAPSGFAWMTTTFSLPASGAPTPGIALYSLDPSNGTALSRQVAWPGQGGAITLLNSNPAALSVTPDTLPLSGFSTSGFRAPQLAVTGGGTADIAIVQPPGFSAPVARGPLHVTTVPRSAWNSSYIPTTVVVGVSLQATLSVPTTGPTMTVSSGDPSKLVISSNSSILGTGTVTIAAGPDGNVTVYLQALDGPADVALSLSSPGLATTSLIVQTVAPALAFGGYVQTRIGDVTQRMNTQEGPIDQVVLATVAQPPYGYYQPQVLRPGLDPLNVSITSSNPGVAAVQNPGLLNGLTSQATVQITALSPGTTDLTIVPPPGFMTAAPGSGRTVHVTVDGPSFAIGDLTLGQDLQSARFPPTA